MNVSLRYEEKVFANFSPEDMLANGVPADVVVKAIHQKLSQQVDKAAGNARAAFVSPGSYIDQEYLLAKTEAADWLASGKDEADIPSSVSDHMAMFDVGAEAAAEEIVATAEAWEASLREIRQLRLGGKAAVSRAETIEEAEKVAQQAIDHLNGYRPPEAAASN